MVELLQVDPKSSIWSLLDLTDSDLERIDVVILNLVVARGIESLKDLDVQKYIDIVDDWTEQFKRYLAGAEARNFYKAPHKFKNDVNFYRIGALAGFLGRHLGIAYIESQLNAVTVAYTNPSDLFLNGVIDTRRGTCGNLSTLHVAISRRMGWPVSLCSAKTHWLSRYDDGKAVYTIECSRIGMDGFAADTDAWYMDHFKLPKRAVLCGSELRKLTAREMLGAFLAKRGRHHVDSHKWQLADSDYSLARHLFPNHRQTHMRACAMMFKHGANLYEPHETGHMNSFFEDLCPVMAPDVYARRNQLYARQPLDTRVQFANPLSIQPRSTLLRLDAFPLNKLKSKLKGFRHADER